MAATLACGVSCALSHRSAAANWGLTPVPRILEVLRSSSPDHSFPNYAAPPTLFGKRLLIHRSRVFGPEEHETVNGIETTTVPRTFLDLASIWSIGRLDSAFSEAERTGLVKIEEMKAITRRGKGWTGIGKLREVINAWDPANLCTKSELESEFLRLCAKHEIPGPAVNTIVNGFEVDCAWPEARLIVELDGYRYHRSPIVFARDQERTAALEDLGFKVLRLSHTMVTQEEHKTARRIKARLKSPSGSDRKRNNVRIRPRTS